MEEMRTNRTVCIVTSTTGNVWGYLKLAIGYTS